MHAINVILIAETETLAQACLADLAMRDRVHVHRLPSIAEFRAWAPGKAISGMLIELRTLISSDAGDRLFINDLTDSLPIAKIREHPKTHEIMGTIDTSALAGPEFLAHFARKVSAMPPRFLRRFPRKRVILNVRVRHESLGPEPFQTSTVDASHEGAFLISGRIPPVDAVVKLNIIELSPTEWFTGRVRWGIEWGKSSSHHPGFGVQFDELPGPLHEALVQLLGLETPDLG